MYHSHVFDNYVRDTVNIPLCTVKCKVAPVQFTFSPYETISNEFYISDLLISDFKLLQDL